MQKDGFAPGRITSKLDTMKGGDVMRLLTRFTLKYVPALAWEA